MWRPIAFVIVTAVVGANIGVASAADMPVKAAPIAPVAAGPWAEVWSGADVTKDSVYGYGGAVFALGGNLSRDGWLFRVSGGGGHYDYNRAVGLGQGVDFWNGDLMVGYQTFLGQTRLTGYLGAYLQDDNNPDPAATVTGTKAGFKVQGEIYAPFGGNWYLSALGSYATAWNTYLVQAKLGYQVTPLISIGPEAMAIGNDRFGQDRVGGFIAFNIFTSAQLILAGGYAWDTRTDILNDHSGGYGSLHVRWTF